MFGTLGGPELFLIFVVALIVFGPRKLPEIGKSLGRMMSEFRRASNDFRSTIESEVEAEKIRDSMRIEAPRATTPPKEPVPAGSPDEKSADESTTEKKDALPDPAASPAGEGEAPPAPDQKGVPDTVSRESSTSPIEPK